MVRAAYDTSNLVALYNGGVQCETCCVIGDPCTHCDIPTPKTVFLQITGAADNFEGVCECNDFSGFGSRSSKIEGVSALVVLNDVIVECTQSTPCIWSGSIVLDSATLKRYATSCAPLDCTGAVAATFDMCTIAIILTKNATTTRVRMVLLGDESPSSSCTDAQIAWRVLLDETFACDGSSCMCCERESNANTQYWDMSNGTIRTWSALCPTMHVNDISAQAIVSDCTGDEEKAEVTVTIHDSDDAVLENAHVEITLTGEVEEVVYADTNGSGVATYTSDCLCIDGTISVEVTNITKGGYVWDSDDDDDLLTESILMDCV